MLLEDNKMFKKLTDLKGVFSHNNLVRFNLHDKDFINNLLNDVNNQLNLYKNGDGSYGEYLEELKYIENKYYQLHKYC
jgi:archaellum component FlaC